MSGFDWESLKTKDQVSAFVSSVERAQLILDNAAGSGGESLSASVASVDSNAIKGVLETLRLVFQCGSNPVLSRLKRSSGLVKYLCDIITFKSAVQEQGSDVLDVQMHSLRGKALSIVASLLLYVPPTPLQLPHISANQEESENVAIMHSVCFVLHYVQFLFGDADTDDQSAGVPDAMHGYVLLNQCVAILEIVGSQVR
jgi:hypothetical protein